jgi:L-asparaginase
MKEDEKQVPFLLTKRIRFHDATPPLASIADVYVEELLHLPSPHMTSREMLQLRSESKKQPQMNKWKDSVVTHGTDTLEETAYFF